MYDSLEINVLFPIIISDNSWTVLMLLTETGYEIESLEKKISGNVLRHDGGVKKSFWLFAVWKCIEMKRMSVS